MMISQSVLRWKCLQHKQILCFIYQFSEFLHLPSKQKSSASVMIGYLLCTLFWNRLRDFHFKIGNARSSEISVSHIQSELTIVQLSILRYPSATTKIGRLLQMYGGVEWVIGVWYYWTCNNMYSCYSNTLIKNIPSNHPNWYTFNRNTHMCMYIHMHTHARAHAHTHTNTHTCTHAHTHARTHAHTCTHTHTQHTWSKSY